MYGCMCLASLLGLLAGCMMIPSGYAYYVRVRTLAVLSTTTTAVRYAYSAVPAGTAYGSRYSCSCSNSDLQNTASLLAGPGVIHHTKPSQQVETLHIRRASKAPHLVAGQGNTLVVINQAGFAARARSPPPPGPLVPRSPLSRANPHPQRVVPLSQ